MMRNSFSHSIRRILAVLCMTVLSVMAFFLSACGSTEQTVVTPEPSVDVTPEPTPEPTPFYDLSFTVGGQSLSPSVTNLDLTSAEIGEIERLVSVLPGLPQLRTIELGSANAEAPTIPWELVCALHQGAPQATLNYLLTLRGYSFSLSDVILNLNHFTFSDEGALALQIASCMPNLKLLDMDSCGVSNKSMAAIRDQLPGVDVVWRVWFGVGDGYSVRTDVDRILASNPDRGGHLIGDAADGLYYCTKVKYLDLGHNDLMSDISFVANMPDLEVLIISMCGVKDISPLANCPKLNYLEYATAAAADLTPLSGLTMLKDVNICYNFALCDIRPLYGLDLDRLWIGCYDPVPKEQIEEFKRLHPNCVVNTTTDNPTEQEWRILDDYYPPVAAPRYAQLSQEFQYDNFPRCYAYKENDPKLWGRYEYTEEELRALEHADDPLEGD